MNKINKIMVLLGFGLFAFVGCTDLELTPGDGSVNETIAFSDPSAYKQYLAKLYAGLAVSGQEGPAGKADIAKVDEGFGQYLRAFWYTQELPTDEAVIGWGDQTIADFHDQDWTSADVFIAAMYYRIFFQVVQCNEFLRQAADDKLSSRSIPEASRTEIRAMRADARFLRALSYWHAIDLFANVPFVTEANDLGGVKPTQTSRAQLFTYIESELKAIEADLPAPKKGEYARADQAAAWALLAKLYMNAEVYTGQSKYSDALTYCNKVIASNAFSLQGVHSQLFGADNHKSPEIIFPIAYDNQTRTYGGTKFLMNAAFGGAMLAADYGMADKWGGLRVTSGLVNLYADDSAKIDKRSVFFRNGQNKEIDKIGTFTEGYGFPKFTNIKSDGKPGVSNQWPDTDFPVFRLADVQLMYAEATLRQAAGGNRATALGYINAIRARAYGNATGAINDAQMTLNFILDERGRELAWEGHRRTDLIRFGKFSDAGIWPWKGGIKAGKTTEKFRDIYPIPSADLIANPNLKQNTGY
jgi:starch-binding outer membrane protein, SusD/RagB family